MTPKSLRMKGEKRRFRKEHGGSPTFKKWKNIKGKKIRKFGSKPEKRVTEIKGRASVRREWPIVNQAAGSSNEIRTQRSLFYLQIPSGWVL